MHTHDQASEHLTRAETYTEMDMTYWLEQTEAKPQSDGA
jgi:hypothetical protein